MKKLIVLIAAFIILCPANIFALPSSINVITDSIKVYAQPTTASTIIATVTFGEEFNVTGADGEFYKIEINNGSGYILKAYCVDSANAPLKTFLDTNAKLNSNSPTFELVNKQYQQTQITLPAQTKIKILNGYNVNTSHTLISFEYNGEILTQYVETKNIQIEGIQTRQIVAIMLIVSCVSLVLIFYSFFKGKKTN